MTAGESLTAARDRINLQTGSTGVVASVSGNNLYLTSSQYGGDQFVYVEVTSGSFSTNGTSSGSGKIDYGKNAKVEMNGTDYYGAGNHFSSITIGAGTFTFDVVAGFQAVYDSITVTSTPGEFELTGGNGDGTADGEAAQATINGQSLTGEGNTFHVSTDHGSFDVEFAEGFSGAFDPITISRDVTNITAADGADTALNFAVFAGASSAASLTIRGVLASTLGGETGTLEDLATGAALGGLGANAADALLIADEALEELDALLVQVGAFSSTTLSAATELNADLQAQLEESIASIDTVDEAEETALMSRNLLLAQNAAAALTVMSQHRETIVALLYRTLGLA